MADFWKIAATCVVVLGWMVAPVITALVNKHFTNLSVDLAQELMALEVCTILTLKKMLTRVQKLRIEEAAKKKVSESDDLKTLDQLGKYLRSALYDAEDILDFVEYHRIEKERCTWWQRLGKAVGVACIARCCKRLFGQLGRSTVLAAVRLRMGCSRGLDHLDQQLLQLWRRVVPRRTPEEEEQQPSPDLEARSLPLAPRGTPEEEEQQPSPDPEARCLPPADGREASFNFVLRRLHSCLLATKNCCGSILSWLVYTFQLWRRVVPRRTPEEEEQQPSPDLEARSLPLAPRGTPEEEEQQPSPDPEARCLPPADGREASFNFVLRRLHSCLLATKNCCGSILSWLVYTFQLWRRVVPRRTPEEEEQQPSPDLEARSLPLAPRGTPEEEEQQPSPDLEARCLPPADGREASFNFVLRRLHSCFLATKNCCGSILSWLVYTFQLWKRVVPRRTPEEEEQQPSPDLEARSLPLAPRGTPEEEEQQPSPDLEARCLPPADGREASFNFVLRRLHSCFLATKNCCGSILSWLVYTFQQLQYLMGGLLRGFLDWLSEVVGIKHNKKDGIGLDSFQLLIYGKSLRKRMKHIESVITVSKESLLLLNEQSSSKLFVNDTDKESSSSPSVQDKEVESRRKRIKEIADVHTDIAQPEPVFGREKDQKDVCKLLRKGPNSCYSVICILGIAGSGKTTLARYVCDYEKKLNNKHFDPIMFIEVSKTFRLHDIFIDMLTEISGQDGQSSRNESQCEELTGKSEGRSLKSLCAELKEELKGKRFLLVLDDLWVIDENRKEMDILLDVLTSGNGGSRILVTAQKEVAGVGPYAPKNFKIGKLEPKYYLSLFLHYAGLPDVVDDDSEFKKIGSKIAEKLHRSPRAAVTVARRLWGASISTWETTANLDELNGTMEALWWSYEQLSLDIRRCFEYCCIFPRGCKFDRVELVRMWIAQGFVSTRSKKEEPEDVGQRYFDELLAFSFFSRTPFARFTIHDLLYELVERVAGSDFLRIGVNGFDSRQGIPSEVRHLSIDTYDRWEMTTEQILELENLRTLIIEEKYHLDEYTTFDDEQPHNLIEEKLLDERIFKKMRKLRVLIVILKYRENRVFSISESIGQMKHLRLFHFYCRVKFRERENIFTVRSGPPKMNLILPNTFSQLYQMQDIELLFSGFSRWKKKVHSGIKVSLPEDLVDNLIQLRRLDTYAGLPNIGGLTSLQSAINFDVKKEEGYELKQLKHLNKLRGLLHISGLKNVRSKDEALEGNLTSKTRLTKLVLNFIGSDPNMVEDVLEGLLPPKDLKKLIVLKYRGSWCPSWMCQNPDAPKNLGRLILYKCSQLVHIPEGSEFFAGLRCLTIWFCIWDALPDHMERLSSLKKLEIWNCDEIELLPTRPPPSLEISIIGKKNKLWKSLQEEKHENRQRFEVVSSKELNQYTFAYGVPIQLICRPFRNGRQVTVLTPSTSPAAVISSQPCPTTNGEIEELQDI